MFIYRDSRNIVYSIRFINRHAFKSILCDKNNPHSRCNIFMSITKYNHCVRQIGHAKPMMFLPSPSPSTRHTHTHTHNVTRTARRQVGIVLYKRPATTTTHPKPNPLLTPGAWQIIPTTIMMTTPGLWWPSVVAP